MSNDSEVDYSTVDYDAITGKAISQPLVTHIYTADPSAHVFDGKLYIYPSHDIEAGIPFNDNGDHFDMRDYHVLRIDSLTSPAVDCGNALDIRDVKWAQRQMWAPDAATKNGKYYLYFPAKRSDGIFQIGVAVGDKPEGPFKPEPEAIKNSYSIDPAVLADDDGSYYMYFGGIWGGQLQKYRNNAYGEKNEEPADHEPALGPRVARLSEDMKEFAEPVREIKILDESGKPILAGDHDRRFFEASWMHKYKGKYYFSYSTGDTHFLCYATGDNPYGPFTYQGRILTPVIGWTTHHSICEFKGKWYLFYHDSVLSKGVTHLRSVKMTELTHDANGRIQTITPYRE
ncbi:MAG: glycoside hydrolase family 43 protein [Povalibacter sp.]